MDHDFISQTNRQEFNADKEYEEKQKLIASAKTQTEGNDDTYSNFDECDSMLDDAVSTSDNGQVIKQEKIQSGSVSWDEYRQLFKFAPGGMCGILTIIFLHFVINICTMGVSMYLSYALTYRF